MVPSSGWHMHQSVGALLRAGLRLLAHCLMPAAVTARSLALAVCSSDKAGDSAHSACVSWCKAENMAYHCEYCKCDFCDFCHHRGVLPVAPRRERNVVCPEASGAALRLTACGSELRRANRSF